MTAPILLCTDGSELALAALRSGMALLGPDHDYEVVSVIAAPDPTLVVGTGMAGGLMSAEEYDATNARELEQGQAIVAEAAAALGIPSAATQVLVGDSARGVCARAEEVGAKAIVIGSRGRGGLKRAVLGSVSDHIVRNAPCPVVVTGPDGTDTED